jgi:tRNA A-37 threonylcarbamoyl transferase component Bud32
MSEIWTADGADNPLAALGIEKVDDAWRPGFPGEMVNDRGDRQVVRIEIPEWDRAIYLKRWRIPPGSPSRWLPGKNALRNRGASEFRNLKDLSGFGIKVPTPLFFGEERGLFGPVASILGLEDLAGYDCSLDWGKEHPEALGAVGRGVGKILGTLHAAGIYHRSPGLKHFYLDPSDPDAPFAMIDVPRLDRVAPGTTVKATPGKDVPCPERDLSKTLLAFRGAFPNAGNLEPGFWESYCSTTKRSTELEALKASVEEWTRVRQKDREERSARKDS